MQYLSRATNTIEYIQQFNAITLSYCATVLKEKSYRYSVYSIFPEFYIWIACPFRKYASKGKIWKRKKAEKRLILSVFSVLILWVLISFLSQLLSFKVEALSPMDMTCFLFLFWNSLCSLATGTWNWELCIH